MLIYPGSGKTKAEQRIIRKNMTAGINATNNSWGCKVVADTSGSMTKDSFVDFAIHFCANLPPGAGKDGHPVLLHLDGPLHIYC